MKKSFVVLLFLFSIAHISFGQENNISTIQIKGLRKTNQQVIASFLKAKPFTVLDSVILNEDVQQLKRLASISHAYYEVSKTGTGNFNVSYFLEENKTLIPVVNFWTTTNQQFAYKVGLYEYNFLRRNMTFGGYYQNNGYHSYELNFKAPYLFSTS